MKLSRRKSLHLAAAAAALPAMSRIAFALDYPTRPVRFVVGFPAGSATDIVARLIAQSLSERLGQQFIVDDRPGAGSNLAAEVVVRAEPDGYTLLQVASPNAINATSLRQPQFQFHPRHCAGRGHHAVSLRDGGQFIIPGQDRSRVHRLCQGQSGQNQHGLGGQRNRASCFWRAVHDNDRHQDGACAVSRQLLLGSDRRTGAGRVQSTAFNDRVYQSWHASSSWP